MSFTEALQTSGFVPEKSTEGEFKALKGVYKTQFVVAEEVVSQKDGANQLKVEFKVTEVLAGNESYSKYNEFRKWLALDPPLCTDKKKGIAWILNTLFTAGKDCIGVDDAATIQNIKESLGMDVYVKAWGWKPEDGEKEMQFFSVLKDTVALAQIDKNKGPF